MSTQARTAPARLSLKSRTLKAGAWTIGQHGFETFSRLLSNLIMTRLLYPEAFGIVAASSVLITGLSLVSHFGVDAMIVQSPRGEREDFLRSAWMFLLIRGTVLWLVLCAGCAVLTIPVVHDLLPAGGVFADPSFPLVTAVSGLTLVIGEAKSTVLFLNTRRLNFRPNTAIDIACRIVSMIVLWTWAVLAPGVWALVAGALAGDVLRLALSHTVLAGPRMAFKWEREHFQEIVRFGKWIAVSTIGSFVSSRSDLIFFGFLLPAPMFGVYVVAKTLVDTVEGLLSRLEGALALPVLTEVVRTRPDELRDRYYRFRLPIDLAAASLSGILFAGGAYGIHFLYDQRYAEAGLMVQLLAASLALYPSSVISSAFIAVGDTWVMAGVSMLRAAFLVVCVTGGFFVAGPIGAVAGHAVHRIVPSLAILVAARRRKWISPWRELRIVPLFVAGMAAGRIAVLVMAALGIYSIAQFWRR